MKTRRVSMALGRRAARTRVAVTLAGLAAALLAAPASAAVVDCDSALGSCTASNEGIDSVDCVCTDAVSGGIAGGNEWAALSEAELLLECESFLASWCDPEPDPIACEDSTGSCTVDNDPDSYACECADGSTPSGEGGNAWSGLDEWQLHDVCYEQLEACPPVAPKGGVLCEGPLGWCTVENMPNDTYSCTCDDGSGVAYVGFDDWAGYTEAQLDALCEETLDNSCVPDVSTSTDDGSTDDAGDSSGTSDGGSTSGGSSGSGDDGGSTSAGTDGDETGGTTAAATSGTGSSDGVTGGSTETGADDGVSTSGDDHGDGHGDDHGDGTGGAPGATPSTSSGGCSVGGSFPTWGLWLFALAAIRRRS
ncbi:MAG: hypothetical protein AAF721_03690 [Myxococcota bacterium]